VIPQAACDSIETVGLSSLSFITPTPSHFLSLDLVFSVIIINKKRNEFVLLLFLQDHREQPTTFRLSSLVGSHVPILVYETEFLKKKQIKRNRFDGPVLKSTQHYYSKCTDEFVISEIGTLHPHFKICWFSVWKTDTWFCRRFLFGLREKRCNWHRPVLEENWRSRWTRRKWHTIICTRTVMCRTKTEKVGLYHTWPS
jgi:hypothetical protein